MNSIVVFGGGLTRSRGQGKLSQVGDSDRGSTECLGTGIW